MLKAEVECAAFQEVQILLQPGPISGFKFFDYTFDFFQKDLYNFAEVFCPTSSWSSLTRDQSIIV